ncbi:MAG: hypothetical protein D6754_04910 [Alphaproteobacteria bacterium]|nr:MAG: hypothetical protein D6754_04910 [Alphaproteobacteria bacterium]
MAAATLDAVPESFALPGVSMGGIVAMEVIALAPGAACSFAAIRSRLAGRCARSGLMRAPAPHCSATAGKAVRQTAKLV